MITQSKQKAYDKIKEINPSLSEEKALSISSLVGVGALKFAELKHHRETDYSFDLDKFVALEGFTGPYVMYQVLRAKSILNKTQEEGVVDPSMVLSPEARKLALLMSQTTSVMNSALDNYMPHYLCEHLYNLCQTFSSFYTVTSILKEEDDQKRIHYLGMVKQFYIQGSYLFKALNILLPEEM